MDLILDATNLQFRSYWIGNNKNSIQTTEGLEVGGIYIFLRSLRAAARTLKPRRIWTCWDKKLIWPSSNFRKQAFQPYKQQRDNSHYEGMFDQETLLMAIVETLGCRNIFPRVLEADDIISWLTQQLNETIIVSTDKDLLQLVSSTTKFYDLNKKQLIDYSNFEEEIGIAPNHYLKWKAIQGDSSDNIPKLKGYGPKKAKALVETGNFSQLSDDEQKQLDLNLLVMDLSDSYLKEENEVQFYEAQFNQLLTHNPNFEKFKELCQFLQFKTILKETNNWEEVFKSDK